mmetsp:Transcript_44107/g.125834  ORF Transcript_44107/g.125834 Transcript_44107/m.125834 type:complete len:241 (+) Transcript_44107:344-1066(+)
MRGQPGATLCAAGSLVLGYPTLARSQDWYPIDLEHALRVESNIQVELVFSRSEQPDCAGPPAPKVRTRHGRHVPRGPLQPPDGATKAHDAVIQGAVNSRGSWDRGAVHGRRAVEAPGQAHEVRLSLLALGLLEVLRVLRRDRVLGGHWHLLSGHGVHTGQPVGGREELTLGERHPVLPNHQSLQATAARAASLWGSHAVLHPVGELPPRGAPAPAFGAAVGAPLGPIVVPAAVFVPVGPI